MTLYFYFFFYIAEMPCLFGRVKRVIEEQKAGGKKDEEEKREKGHSLCAYTSEDIQFSLY